MSSSRLTLGTVLVLGFAAFAFADKPVDPVNKNKDGLAVKAYDVVAYFTEGVPTKGDPSFEHEWQGATWRFANAENLEAFEADPERYAPQYGGYCAWAVSKGKTASISVKAWSIIDDKLYLNHALAQGKFKKETAGAIQRADKNWPSIAKKPLQ